MKEDEKVKAAESELDILKAQLIDLMKDIDEPTPAFFDSTELSSALIKDLGLVGTFEIDSSLWTGYDNEK